jgi:cysteine desulfurase/selenocysteine lyase
MTIAVSNVRSLFPALPRFAYLNAAAASPLAAPVADVAKEYLEDMVMNGDLHWPQWLKQKEDLRARLARFIGGKVEEVAFTQSTSMGFSIVGRLLKARGIDTVVTLEGEFPSTTVPLLHAGLRLRVVRPRPDGSYPVSDIEAACGPEVGAIAVSAVLYASGYRINLAQLASMCRVKGLPLALNVAQALGQIPLDVGRLGVDFLCGTSHKWMFGGYGTGIFWAKDDWHDASHYPMAGWLSVRDDQLWDAFPGSARPVGGQSFPVTHVDVREEPRAVEAGGSQHTSILTLSAALELHERLTIESTRNHIVKLQTKLREGLRKRGFVPNAPDAPEVSSGICVVHVEGSPNEAAKALLNQSVVTSARAGGLRISTHVYNDESDLERLFRSLELAGVRPRR